MEVKYLFWIKFFNWNDIEKMFNEKNALAKIFILCIYILSNLFLKELHIIFLEYFVVSCNKNYEFKK